ncbi:MAG: TylF/MycF/NovP-related O-methyltransferase [Alphaproteobacteria bacterium]|jgi:hypothetical protein|nr:TylF/MycF/NovP-related O-methyltransferase [Alphaproteobacteria bacterium]
MFDPISQRIYDDILSHLADVSPGRVALVLTDRARDRFANVLSTFSEERLVLLGLREKPANDVALVVVVACDVDDARPAYAAMSPAKEMGIPVVFCAPGRRVFDSIPEYKPIGLNYSGMFWLASQYIGTVKCRGAYCEFGVFDGMTFSLAYQLFEKKCDSFYAFDSFQGIGGAMETETTHFKDGDYYANVETFRYNMKFIGADTSRITATKGFFDHTLVGKMPADYGIEKISIAHIDVDVYEPALQALEFISSALVQGSLLLFDDYDQLGASNEKGERRAVCEWLAAHPELSIESYRNYAVFGRSFIVHRV